jgi:hypothetical protein
VSLKDLIKSAIGDTLLGRFDYFRYPHMRESWGGPFNGQRHRQRIVAEVLTTYAPAAIVETGTFRGTTTAHIATRFPGPVFTVERLKRNYGFAKQQLSRYPNVRLECGDSVEFLERITARGELPSGRVLYYLDAHWGEELPLSKEIDTVFKARPDAVVMIDDFQVPDDPGYAFDDYGAGKTLNLEYVSPAMAKFDLVAFFPNVASDTESGAKRGCVLLAGAPDVVEVLSDLKSIRRHVGTSVAGSS